MKAEDHATCVTDWGRRSAIEMFRKRIFIFKLSRAYTYNLFNSGRLGYLNSLVDQTWYDMARLKEKTIQPRYAYSNTF